MISTMQGQITVSRLLRSEVSYLHRWCGGCYARRLFVSSGLGRVEVDRERWVEKRKSKAGLSECWSSSIRAAVVVTWREKVLFCNHNCHRLCEDVSLAFHLFLPSLILDRVIITMKKIKKTWFNTSEDVH